MNYRDSIIEALYDRTTLEYEECEQIGDILKRLSVAQADELIEVIIEIK